MHEIHPATGPSKRTQATETLPLLVVLVIARAQIPLSPTRYRRIERRGTLQTVCARRGLASSWPSRSSRQHVVDRHLDRRRRRTCRLRAALCRFVIPYGEPSLRVPFVSKSSKRKRGSARRKGRFGGLEEGNKVPPSATSVQPQKERIFSRALAQDPKPGKRPTSSSLSLEKGHLAHLHLLVERSLLPDLFRLGQTRHPVPLDRQSEFLQQPFEDLGPFRDSQSPFGACRSRKRASGPGGSDEFLFFFRARTLTYESVTLVSLSLSLSLAISLARCKGGTTKRGGGFREEENQGHPNATGRK